ncbi:MAG: serine hydrolase domain-containing protein [Steroidobacteraceae bacterium]
MLEGTPGAHAPGAGFPCAAGHGSGPRHPREPARGKRWVDTIGCQDLARQDPIRRDTIFRIASMTKPITAVAAMILVEECKLTLDEPIDRFLPELANRRVLKRIDGPLDDTTPATRPITLRDLLSFRMGIGVIIGPPGVFPIQKAMDENVLMNLTPAPPHQPDEWFATARQLAADAPTR